MKKTLQIVLMAAAVVGVARAASASTITYVGSSGGLIAAVRITDLAGGVVKVELGNFGAATVNPSDVLTAVFFDGLTSGTPLSAFTSATSSIVGNPTTGCTPNPPGGACPSGANLNVGGEWSGLPVSLGVYDYGISSTGVNIFGGGNFNGLNLSDPNAVNGLNFGLVSIPNGISGAANPQVNSEALVRGIVTFTLQGPAGFTATNVTGVRFQFGTALDEPNFPGNPVPPGEPTPFGAQSAPEPASLILMATGLLGAGRIARRRLKK